MTLRPQRTADLPLLVGGDTPFDDFGPMASGSHPAPSRLDDAGALAVVDEAGEVAGDVSWHWRGWGPNAGSRCVMIGIWLRPEHRGRGLGRLAQRRVVELFFTHTRANRVEAHTDVENVAEQRALEARRLHPRGADPRRAVARRRVPRRLPLRRPARRPLTRSAGSALGERGDQQRDERDGREGALQDRRTRLAPVAEHQHQGRRQHGARTGYEEREAGGLAPPLATSTTPTAVTTARNRL